MNVSTELRVLAPPVVPSSPAELLLAPRATVYNRYVKRPLDITLALVALLVALPVLLGSGGVLYRQARVGREGQPFTIYKFRSMLPDRRMVNSPTYIGPERRVTHKSPNDPRHRPFGRFLRATSIDELPQLLNVLRGEMSLVGPRPELCAVARREGFVQHPRHLARPGLTGMFQVSPLRSTNRISSGLHLDLDYVAHVRFARDLRILARTVLIPFVRRGS